jgi:hypothetical protein
MAGETAGRHKLEWRPARRKKEIAGQLREEAPVSIVPNDDAVATGQRRGVGDAPTGQRPRSTMPSRILIESTTLDRGADLVEPSVPRYDCRAADVGVLVAFEPRLRFCVHVRAGAGECRAQTTTQ